MKGVSIISVNDVGTFIYQLALSKETISVVFLCRQDCCFVPVYYMSVSQVYFTIRTFQENASRKQRKDHAVIKAECTL